MRGMPWLSLLKLPRNKRGQEMINIRDLLVEGKTRWPDTRKAIIPVRGAIKMEFAKRGNQLVVATYDDYEEKPTEIYAAYRDAIKKAWQELGGDEIRVVSIDKPYSEKFALEAKTILQDFKIEVSVMT